MKNVKSISMPRKEQKVINEIYCMAEVLDSWVSKTLEFFEDNIEVKSQYLEWMKKEYPKGI